MHINIVNDNKLIECVIYIGIDVVDNKHRTADTQTLSQNWIRSL